VRFTCARTGQTLYNRTQNERYAHPPASFVSLSPDRAHRRLQTRLCEGDVLNWYVAVSDDVTGAQVLRRALANNGWQLNGVRNTVEKKHCIVMLLFPSNKYFKEYIISNSVFGFCFITDYGQGCRLFFRVQFQWIRW